MDAVNKSRHADTRTECPLYGRTERVAKRNVGHGFEEATSYQALYEAFYIAKRGTNWKASVQNYGSHVVTNTYKQHKKLREGKYKPKGFVEFDLMERGKKRHIMSVHISERVVQKAICQRALIPVLEKSLIYDNGASQKDKGTEFAARRLKKHLSAYYRRNGNDGYVILGDEHDYFASLRHENVRYILERHFTDRRLIELVMMFVDAVPKGLSLGSEVNQILAVSYANDIDHYIKDELGIKYYGHYMDDWYIIVKTKDEARRLLAELRQRYRDIGITLNEKKTQIVKLR